MDDRILDLVEQWEDARRAGRTISVDVLCCDCPELLDEVTKRITALEATAWMDKPVVQSRIDDNPPASGSSRIGRYELQSLIGRGGFGEVWKAFDPELQRPVAIKIPRLDRRGNAGQSEKFLEEARKVAQLNHPGIVPVHDVGRDGDRCFIVSELVVGQSLAEFRAHELSAERAALLVANVADALDYAHRQGFIHSDVKPQNVLVDEWGQPHLTDFGIAITEDQPAHEKSTTIGTLAYMSPEQAQGEIDRIDSRTDVYSLGVVLYELLTGRLPFLAADTMNLWASIISSAPRPPRTIDASIPVALERICLRAVAKKPEDRFSTAGDFGRELRAAVAKPAKAHWHRWIGLAAALLALAGLGLLVREYRRSWEQVDRLTGQSHSMGSKVAERFDQESQKAQRQLEAHVAATDDQQSIPNVLPGQQANDASILPNISKSKNPRASSAAALGKAAVNRGDQEMAIREFSAALDEDPSLAEAWHGRGAAHFNRTEFAAAESDFRQAVQLRPSSLEFRKNYAYTLVRLNRHDDAVKVILEGLKQAKPEDEAACHREVARIYKARAAKHQAAQDHDAALADLKEAVGFDPTYADGVHDLGCAYFNVGDFEKAVEHLSRAIELDPTKPDYFLHRGHALRRLGKEEQGLADYDAARRLAEKSSNQAAP